MRLARVLHCALGLIASGNEFDAGVLNSIKAASENIINGNRDATDAELLGLENLVDQLIPSAAEVSVPPEQTAASTAGDEQGSEVQASEAGGDSSSQGSESVTAVAPLEASSEAPAEPPAAMQDEGDLALTEEPQPAPIPPHEELFAPQSHDEDDGA